MTWNDLPEHWLHEAFRKATCIEISVQDPGPDLFVRDIVISRKGKKLRRIPVPEADIMRDDVATIVERAKLTAAAFADRILDEVDWSNFYDPWYIIYADGTRKEVYESIAPELFAGSRKLVARPKVDERTLVVSCPRSFYGETHAAHYWHFNLADDGSPEESRRLCTGHG